MYTLARTQKIYGSFQSSFSNIAAQLGRVPLEILKLQAPHFSICFNSFFPPPFIYRQNALPVGVPVMKEHPVIVLSSSFPRKRLVSVSAILYSILKVKSLMIPFQSLAFSHLSGSSCLYFSSGVFGCHSAVLFMISVRYSNRFTLFILQVSAIVYSMAPRSAPLWLPKNNEFFLDKDMYRFIRSTILLSR